VISSHALIHRLEERGLELERSGRKSLAKDLTVEKREELEKDLEAAVRVPETFGGDMAELLLEFFRSYKNHSTKRSVIEHAIPRRDRKPAS